MPESAGAAVACGKLFNNLKISLHDRNEYHLRNPHARFDHESIVTAVPARDENLTLIV